MKIMLSRSAVDPFNIVSVNEDIKLNFPGGTPGFELEDDSILVFYDLDSDYFIYESGLYNKDNHDVDMQTLEKNMIIEDDLPIKKYMYYNKPLSAVSIYDIGNEKKMIRLFREEL